MVPTSFLGDIQEGEHLRMVWKGLWVSLAYTRAFGTLGPQFKSGQTHHQQLDLRSTNIRGLVYIE